jgi:hypothetical protein
MSDQMPTRSAKSARTIARAIAAVATLAAAAFASGEACAAPATLANDADVAAFARRITAYRDASRVHWVVAAPTRAAAEGVIANIGLHLTSDDQSLVARVSAQSFADSPEIAPGSSVPVAWMAPQTTQAAGGQKCSWQVWVTDPSLPSPGPGGVSLPLAPNDKLPVGAGATFRVGYTGLLQSKLYAFDETQPGAIRDLATAPDVNIPVATGPGRETVVLAMARHPAPFLEGIRTALASSEGQRRDLGKEYALRDTLLVRGAGLTRQVGANIQFVTRDNVEAKRETGGAHETPVAARAVDGHVADELTETCLYYMTPMMTQ